MGDKEIIFELIGTTFPGRSDKETFGLFVRQGPGFGQYLLGRYSRMKVDPQTGRFTVVDDTGATVQTVDYTLKVGIVGVSGSGSGVDFLNRPYRLAGVQPDFVLFPDQDVFENAGGVEVADAEAEVRALLERAERDLPALEQRTEQLLNHYGL